MERVVVHVVLWFGIYYALDRNRLPCHMALGSTAALYAFEVQPPRIQSYPGYPTSSFPATLIPYPIGIAMVCDWEEDTADPVLHMIILPVPRVPQNLRCCHHLESSS